MSRTEMSLPRLFDDGSKVVVPGVLLEQMGKVKAMALKVLGFVKVAVQYMYIFTVYTYYTY